MIVVQLHLWPGGDETLAEDLGKAVLWNTSGSGDTASYEVRLLKGARYSSKPGEVWKKGRVPAFPRNDKRWGPWELLASALEATVGSRVASLKRHLETAARASDVMYGAGYESPDGGSYSMFAGPNPDLGKVLESRPESPGPGEQNTIPVIVRFEGEDSRVTHVWLDGLGWSEI